MAQVSPQHVPVYRGLNLAARPARVAVFFPVDQHWKATLHRILEDFSRIWGGAGNIVIPCDENGTIPPVFYRVLRAFDPDYLALYVICGLDLKFRDPREFARRLDEHRRYLIVQEIPPTTAEEFVEEEVRDPCTDWKPSEKTMATVLTHCAPIHHGDIVFTIPLRADFTPPWELTDIASMVAIEATSYAEVNTSRLDPSTQLMVASRVGGIAPSFRDALGHRSVSVRQRAVSPGDCPMLWENCWQKIVGPGASSRSEEYWNDSETPLGRSMLGCGKYLSPRMRVRAAENITVVVGDAAEDYCLWLALDRMMRISVWAPTNLFEANEGPAVSFEPTLTRYLLSASSYLGTPCTVHVTSASSEAEYVAECASRIGRAFAVSVRAHGNNVVSVGADNVVIQRRYRYLENSTAGDVQNVPFVDDVVVFPIETPMPREVTTQPELDLKWFVDVDVRGYAIPPRAGLVDVVACGTKGNLPDMRCSESGLSYSARSPFQRGDELQHNLVRPRFRLPTVQDILGALLGKHDLQVEPSDKGRFATASLSLWGGLDALIEELSDTKRRAIFKAFLKPGRQDAERGRYLTATRRWYLSLIDMVITSGLTKEDVRTLLDSYAQRGIVSRGLILQCPVCKDQGWFPLSQLGDDFSCKRCRTHTALTKQAWREPLEPRWYYELNEVVYQFLEHNGELPLFALHALKRDAVGFQFAPELIVTRRGTQVMEIDICAFRDSEIVLGEVTKSSRLDDSNTKERTRVHKLKTLSSHLGADLIVFGTEAKSWRAETREMIQTVLQGSFATIQFMEGLGKPVDKKAGTAPAA